MTEQLGAPESFSPDYETIKSALEEISSGTVLIDDKRITIDDVLSEWAEDILFGRRKY